MLWNVSNRHCKYVIKVVFLIHYFNKKKIQEDKIDYRFLELAMKTKNTCIATALNHNVLQSIKKSFDDIHLDSKVYQISKFHNCHYASSDVRFGHVT